MTRTIPPTLPLFEVDDPSKARQRAAQQIRPSNPGLAEAVEAADPDWWDQAVAAVRKLAATGAPFQAYDLVTRCGLPEPSNPAKQWGALFAALSREGLIIPTGYGHSRRPTARSSAARIWRGAQ
ncbi:hypothetical protein ABZ801_01250 [Actinomadura sp. NPDC047616]|uniref:hypothetical protein n=1 Tax=Actinomadura sp. NPDC047616 TaxID=3155914 RepID=UPI0033E638FA